MISGALGQNSLKAHGLTPSRAARYGAAGGVDSDRLAARLAQRSDSDAILERARSLPDRERALVEAVLRDGVRVSQLSKVTGIPDVTLRRDIARLLRRLTSRECAFVLAFQKSLPESRRRVAVACFVHGMSIRRAAAALGMTFYGVRRHHDALRAMFEAAA